MKKKMSQKLNDSYTSAITASTENQDQSFNSKYLENTNDILMIRLNEFCLNKNIKKQKENKSLKKLSNKTFFLSNNSSKFKEDEANIEKWFTNKIGVDFEKNTNKKIYKLFKDDKFKKKGHQILMAKKERGIYTIRNNFGIVAKIRYNIFSNHFKVLDENNNLIEEIIYKFNFRGWNGPTKLKIILPKVNSKINQNQKSFTKIINNKNLVHNLENKPPIYNEFFRVYTLNFKDRNVIPNEKNFQVIFSKFKEDNNDILLQFAHSKDGVILDYKFPFNNITAFALSITAMASRTFCK